MSAIEERLRAAAADPARGDWQDVVTRAEPIRRRARMRRAALAIAAALILAVPALALADRLLDEPLVVSPTEDEIPMRWISADRAYNVDGKEARLAAAVNGDVSDRYFSPAAVLSPDRASFVYHSFDPPPASPIVSQGVGVLRLHDLVTGEERVFERGARSVAWRADGAIAYAKGRASVRRRFSSNEDGFDPSEGALIGHILVRESLDSPAKPWTRLPSEYTVLAWADTTLLAGASTVSEASVERLFDSREQAEQGVYAIDGPGRVRKLPIGGVIAVSPSGDLVVGPASSSSPADVPTSGKLRIVRVEDGRVLSELDLPPIMTPERPYARGYELSGAGSWAGNYIVVAYRTDFDESFPPPLGHELFYSPLLVLRFDDGRLSVAHVFTLEPSSARDAGFTNSSPFSGPRFIDDKGRAIVAWSATRKYSSVFLRCDRVERRCSRSGPLPRRTTTIPGGGVNPPGIPKPEWPAFLIENPSRPLDE